MSGRFRLLALFVALSLAPLGLLAYVSVDFAGNAVRDEVQDHVSTTSLITAAVVEREMRSLAELVQSFSTRPGLVAAVGSGDPATYDTAAVELHLNQLSAARPGVSGAFLTDAAGHLTAVFPSTPEIVGRDFSFRDWYQGLRRSGGPYVSEAYETALAGNPMVVAVVAYVMPTDSDRPVGQPLAVIAATYRLDALQEFTRQVTPSDGVRVRVTDQRGNLVAGADRPLRGLRSTRHEPAVSAALQGRSGVDEYAGAVVGFDPVARLGWTVTASIPSSTAFGAVDRLRSSVLTVAALLSIGLFAGLLVLLRTERRRSVAESAVRSSEIRMRGIIDGAQDAFVSVNRDGRITAWNPRAEVLFGRPAGEVLGQPAVEILLPAERRSEAADWLAGVLGGGHDGELGRPVETVVKDRSGNAIPVEVGFFRAANGGALHAFIRDLRERKKAEEATARLAAIVNSSSDAIFSTSLEGVITSWNPGAEALYGYRAEQAIGRAVTMLLPPDRPGEVEELLASVRRGTAVQQHETVRVRADGIHVPVSLTVSPVRDATGDVIGASVIAHDITGQRAAAAALEAARDEAMEASRLKSQFLANMSHEIRTPMNGVLGMLSILQGTDMSPEQLDYVQTAERSAEALLTVINDILDFSKVEAGRLEFEDIDFDLRAVVEDVAHSLAPVAHEKGLELACLIPPHLPRAVRGDPGRLRQVLTNLTSNAVKFTDAGEIVVRVEPLPADGPELRMAFEVIDTGLGIAPEHIDLVFDSFSQADVSTTRRYGGTGLGLAISARLVEMMGGKFEVDSEPGRGSTFRFIARFGRADEDAVPGPPAREELAGSRVLIVDDNATNRLVLLEMLSAWSMHPTTVTGGAEALTELKDAARRGSRYDVVVLDLNMPDMDGLEVAREIRKDPLIADVATVLLTSSVYGDEARQAVEAGIDGYLTKPVRQWNLHDCLATVLGQPVRGEPIVTTRRLAEARTAGRRRVLVVEDNPVNCKVAVVMLERLGYAADVTVNGAEALPAVLAGGYDAVLMDCQMPVMDGYEATREIRRRESESGEARRTPIVAMTAAVMQGDRERCLAAGMDDYLAKPLRPPELEQVLRRWVEDQGPPAVAPPARAHDEPSILDDEVIAGLVTLGNQAGTEVLAEVLDIFTRDAAIRLDGLRSALEAGDATAVREVAHALKGSAATLGARAVAAVAAQLEDAGRTGALSGAEALLDELHAELPRAQVALRGALL